MQEPQNLGELRQAALGQAPGRAAWALALALIGAGAALLLRDLFLLHPAYATADESMALVYTQLGLEGRHLGLTLGTGSWLRLLQWLSARAFGASLACLHLPLLAGLALEGLLLWRLARRLAGPQAALGALFFNFICAFTWIRGRSLLSFALLPCELLLVLNLLLPQARAWPAFLGALLAGLFCLDYEAWVLGVAVVGALALAGFSGPRRKAAVFAGLALGTAVAAWLGRHELASWYLMRKGFSGTPSASLGAEFAGNLRVFFWGGECVAYLGPDGHSAVPRWGLPFMIVGLWQARRRLWVWPWLALGLAPLAATAYASEPNRAIVAWPLLSILGGWGWSAFWEAMKGRASGALLGLLMAALLLAGWADEAAAFAGSMAGNYPLYYAPSAAKMQAAQLLQARAKPGGIRLLSHLSLFAGAELRFLAGDLHPAPESPLMASIADDAMPTFNDASGVWTLCQPYPGVAPERLLQPSPALAARLSADDQALQAFEGSLTLFDKRRNQALIFAWLDSHPGAGAWQRTALWTEAMGYASLSGDISPSRLDALLAEKLSSAAPLYEPGVYLLRSHPAQAWRMLQKARILDPRRRLDAATDARIRALAGAAPGP